MAYPASTKVAANALDSINRYALSAKASAQALKDASLIRSVPRVSVLELQANVATAIAQLDVLSGAPGLQAYARDQFSNQSLDIEAEFMAMRSAMLSLTGWIFTNFPRDAATQAVLVSTYNAEGVPLALTFTTAELAELRTKIDLFSATVA